MRKKISKVKPMVERHAKKALVPAKVPEPENLVTVIAKAAADPNVDVTKMKALLDMHERIVAKNAETVFAIAMNEAQSEIGRIAADADNKATQSRYATYAALDRVLRPVYTKNGFSLSFDTEDSPENVVKVLCYVSHKAGHTRTYRAGVPSDGKGAKGGDVMTKTHAFGSGMQYGMRYLLKFIFNVAIGEDDDGNAAAAGPKITEEQVIEINKLLNDTDSGTGRYVHDYLEYLSKLGKTSISRVEEIPAVMFKDAKAVLERKKTKVAHD